MYRQKGFTLIELVVVIVILGLLAATALPRFVDLTGNAREASVAGVAGGLRSAAALSKAHVLVNGSGGGSITMDGVAVAVNVSGYPTAAAGGIELALPNPTGWSTVVHGATSTYGPDLTGRPNCAAVYNPSTGAVAVSATSTTCL